MASCSLCLRLPGILSTRYSQALKLTGCRHVSRSWILPQASSEGMKGRKKSSQEWIARQKRDKYVKQARNENYRCRSAFKLLEIDDRFNILKPGDVVIDCGAAPGSWSQVAVNKVCRGQEGPQGMVISIDLQTMTPVDGAFVLHQSDFILPETQAKVLKLLGGHQANVVLSDMAPKATGIKEMDHEQIVDLCIAVLRFSVQVLGEGGTVLCKLWQGGEQHKLEQIMNSLFSSTRVVKPEASRSESAELFLLGRGFRGRPVEAPGSSASK